MHCSPYLPVDYGLTPYMPLALLQYFWRTKYYVKKHKKNPLLTRGKLLYAIKSRPEFLNFWTHIQEQHPEKEKYLLSLTNHAEPYDSKWILGEYKTYQLRIAFEALPEEDQRVVQNEFDELRASVYRAALRGEAKRLNCEIADVILTSHVLPWDPEHDEESILARLPEELFGRVCQLLEAIDIFRITLVCKSWKRLIYDNSTGLKKAEHALTTHSIRCIDWMDPSKTPGCRTFLRQYRMFSWCLTRWFIGVAENLDTLILDHQIPYTDLANLLQSCPHLKHLRIGYDGDWEESLHDDVLARVKLSKLEVFMYSLLDCYYFEYRKLCRHLYRDILAFSPLLRVFKGPLDSADFFAIDAQNPVSNVFSKLVVLDLETFTSAALEILAHIDGLQLKYLRLGKHYHDSELDGVHNKNRSRNALHQLLPKLKKLEMLRISEDVGVTNETIQLMTDLELNINWAILYHSYFPESHLGVEVVQTQNHPLQPEVLDAFRSMVLSKNPDINLSEIRLVLREGKTVEVLKAMNTGFTIIEKTGYCYTTQRLLSRMCPLVEVSFKKRTRTRNNQILHETVQKTIRICNHSQKQSFKTS